MTLTLPAMSRRPTTARLISTSARVYPPYLLQLHTASRKTGRTLKWLPPLAAAAVTAGYAATTAYRSLSDEAQHHHHQQQQHHHHMDASLHEAEALADAYGDRGSLEELERAISLYEAQRGRR
ncbi:hypothetical protein VTJ83DRAFT_4479 [Remersonia thermophila]|uniref:Uncharacterized protein n=1 Tax=Remersonia thermophila TaxID=72144 RepID=A0ABR4DA18_9PEZI